VSEKTLALVRHLSVAFGIGGGGVLLALLWPASWEARSTAVVGVVTCAVCGFASLLFKSRARTVNGALLVVVMVFAARAAVALIGATWAIRWGGGVIPFVIGFFGTYFPLQWLEIRYLLVAVKQDQVSS